MATSLTWETIPIYKHIYAKLLLYHTLIQKEQNIISPFENWMLIICKKNKTKPKKPFTQRNLFIKFEIGHVVLERKISIFHQCIFSISLFWFLTLEKSIFFHWTNLIVLHQTMLCVMFDWNWPSDSKKEDFKISSMYYPR